MRPDRLRFRRCARSLPRMGSQAKKVAGAELSARPEPDSAHCARRRLARRRARDRGWSGTRRADAGVARRGRAEVIAIERDARALPALGADLEALSGAARL